MGQLKKVVRLSETDYSTLLNGGSVTKGGKTYTLDANTLYVVEDETPQSYAQRSDYASEAGRAHGADCASRDADGNDIVDTYATKDDVDAALSEKANKSATVSTVGYDTTNKKLTKTINGTTSDVVTASTVVTDGGGYKKPSTGIPKTDLASAVQTSLGKADTALQSHQDISGKADKEDFGFADGTAHTHTNDKTQGTALKIYNPALGSGQTADVVNSSTISGEETEDSADAKTHIPTWQGIMKWVKNLGYATVSAMNTALAAKADKSATVSTVGYDTTNKKLTKTINGSTSDVVTASTVVTDGGGYKKPSTGIPKTDLASAVQTSLGKADTALQSHQDISGKADKSATVSAVTYNTTDKKLTKTINGSTTDVVTASSIVTDGGGYKKPSTGIPKTDLASAVQTSLGKADTALQSHQDITLKDSGDGDTGQRDLYVATAAAGTIVTSFTPGSSQRPFVAPSWRAMLLGLSGKADKTASLIVKKSSENNGVDFNMPDDSDNALFYVHTDYTQQNKPQQYGMLLNLCNSAGHIQLFSDVTNHLWFRSYWWTKNPEGFTYPSWMRIPTMEEVNAKSTVSVTQSRADEFSEVSVDGTDYTLISTTNPGSDAYGYVYTAPSWKGMAAAITSALANYVTTTGLSSTLASYVKSSDFSNALANYLQKGGGTMTGNITFADEKHIRVRTTRKTATQSGWVFPLVDAVDGADSSFFLFGVYGEADAVKYGYIGVNTYSGANLRIYPDGVKFGDNTIWHAGNDGAGSGLDADTLDGKHASAFLTSHQDISGKADKSDFGISDGTAHATTNDTTLGVALKIYNPALGQGGTTDVVLSNTISGSETEDSASAKKHVPTWQGIMKWVKSLGYATASAMNTALAAKADMSETGANALMSKLPVWSASPTDTTYLIRQDTNGAEAFGRVAFSTVWDYIVGKITATANAFDNTAGQRIIPVSNPAAGQIFEGCYGAVLQWTANPTRKPSDGNPSWYFQLFGITDGRLYFRSRTNGTAWTDIKKIVFNGDLKTITDKLDKIYFTDFAVEDLVGSNLSVSGTVLSGFEAACREFNEGTIVVIPGASCSAIATVDTSASSTFHFYFFYNKKYYDVQRNSSSVWSVSKIEYAPTASPTLTGTPKVPTAASGTNTTQIASTAFVQAAVNKRLSQYHVSYPDNDDNAQRWKKIGTYVTNGDGSSFIIEIFSGTGHNAHWYQNASVRVMIKDGYQSTKAAANSVGITVEKFIMDNVNTEVAVVASSDTQGDVWVKVNKRYVTYEYIVYGNFNSWTNNTSYTSENFTTTAPSHNQEVVEYIDYTKGQAISQWISRNNFTDAQWESYSTIAHEEGWITPRKNIMAKGDYFAVTGRSTDTGNWHTAIYRFDGIVNGNIHGKCIRHYNASTPEDAFGLTFRLALNTHVFQSGVTDTGNNFISITALMCDGAGVETLYSAGKIVIKDSTGTVRSTWANKCYATFSGSGFTTFASYTGPFTVELQNASGTVLTTTQIFKV